jgi:serine/threonine protein kinase
MNENTLIATKFKIISKLGQGSFGDVYLGHNIETSEVLAIKVEHIDKKHILKHEYQVYQAIKAASSNHKPRIPKVYWFGIHNNYQVMVMEYLGRSLEFLFTSCNGRFSPKTTIMLGIQILDQLALLHCNGYLHRDIKPENFLMGVGNNNRHVYMIDLGLAKEYKKKAHIKEVCGKNLIGTARYSSINSHKGLELSRRDDLESLGYLLVYFIRGELPWQGIKAKTKAEKYEMIGNKKISTPVDVLCYGTPWPIAQYLKYVRSLDFKVKPDYYYLRKLFVDWFEEQGFRYDYYDWDNK